MTEEPRKIKFKVEFSRILELLADQIYQSPMALLRENTQNAFDAIRMRAAMGDVFDPQISVQVSPQDVVITDNGVGMTADEIEQNFWYAGSSGKNTDEARAAGVVGTFGIGAMANFGIADQLTVESESARTGQRTISSVEKANLSTERDGIDVQPVDSLGSPGTTVTTRLDPTKSLVPEDALTYLKEFVEFVDIPVLFNGSNISGANVRSVLPSSRSAWNENLGRIELAGLIVGDIEVLGMASGELRVIVSNAISPGVVGRPGSLVLVQGGSVVRTLRSGFGLATASVPSLYHWGGIVDLAFLQPTAGREALEATSNQQLHTLISALDSVVSNVAARHSESFGNDGFLRWIIQTGQFSLCGQLEVSVRPSGLMADLSSIVARRGLRYYDGRDPAVITTHASEDEPLVLVAQRTPRRECELGYLSIHQVPAVDVSPRVEVELARSQESFAHTALATRISRLLEEDYFLPSDIRFGTISGNLPLLVTSSGTPVTIFLDPGSSSVAALLGMYTNEFDAFAPFVKDFVRTTVFPRVSNLVPSSSREGAEAFLRRLRSNREWFEYELDDRADLEQILRRVSEGKMTVVEATERLTDAQRSTVEVTQSGTASIDSVVARIESDPSSEDEFGPVPGIDRRDELTSARILTSDDPLNGYRCFLSLSDRVQREMGDFFLQAHTTEVVWGGRKVVFVFQHHSGRFGLYYDILCPGLVGESSGGGQRRTSTILTQDRTFIPLPPEISDSFMPGANEKIGLEIRCDVLYLDEESDKTEEPT